MKRVITSIFIVLFTLFSIVVNAVNSEMLFIDNSISLNDSLKKSSTKIIPRINSYFPSSNLTKIMLTPSMLENKNSDTHPAIIDEQTIAGDPANGNYGNPVTNWTSSWNPNSPYPHYAVLDFGQEINLFAIYIYDVDGAGSFVVESGVEGNWSPLFTDSLTGYNTWNEHPDLSVKTRFLRLVKTEGGARVGEIVVYGVSGDMSSDAFLKDLTVDDFTISGFDSSRVNYNIELPEGTIVVPVINATANHSSATVSVLQASKLPGISTVIVTAENVVTQQFYTVSFTVKNSDVKEYIHLNAERPEWTGTALEDFYEADDFDVFWAVKLALLPPANALWNGGEIDIGDAGKSGIGVIDWKNASSNNQKPLLVVLPSAGAEPGTGICPTNYNYIVASAMDQTYNGATIQGHIEAALAIRQMIKNILASGKCDGRVFVEGKSQGGGMSLITAALCSEVLETFVSVPAMTGYTGVGGAEGAWPGYPSNNDMASYVDACNHAKRITTPVTFSLGFNDGVTWYKGQNTAAKNTQSSKVYLYHNTGGHSDMDWWNEGNKWIGDILQRNDKPTTLVSNVKNNSIITVWPNPVTNGSVNIDFGRFVYHKVTISLLDMFGKNIYTSVVQNVSDKINVEGLSNIKKGVYILKISADSQKSIYKLIF